MSKLEKKAAAANAAAAVLSKTTVPEEKPGLRLSNGELILDYARSLYIHNVAAWASDSRLEGKDIVDLQVDIHPSDDPFYLVHWPGTKKCAIIYPSHGGAGNCEWRMQELKEDEMIESFLRSEGAWH